MPRFRVEHFTLMAFGTGRQCLPPCRFAPGHTLLSDSAADIRYFGAIFRTYFIDMPRRLSGIS